MKCEWDNVDNEGSKVGSFLSGDKKLETIPEKNVSLLLLRSFNFR